MEDDGIESVEFLCPDCKIATTLTRCKSAEFDLSDLMGLAGVEAQPYDDNSPGTVAKNRYIN